jgi:hypothetical protein
MDIEQLCRQLRTKIRAEDKEHSTADCYCNWTKRYLKFCAARKYSKANCTAEKAVELFLSSLANEG